MVQTSIDRYLILPHRTQKPPRNGPGILDLPYEIRKKIYFLAGIARSSPISLNTPPTEEELNQSVEDASVSHRGDIESWKGEPLPIQLLLACRDISQEVSSLLYSQNRFCVIRTAPGGLSGLEKLHPNAIARLQFLRVILNDMFRYPNKLLCGSTMQTRGHNIFITEWKRFCRCLARSIPEFRLRLSVVCDVDNYDLAAAVIQPLKDLPVLAGFSIRMYPEFENDYHKKLLPLVCNLSKEMTSRPISSMPVSKVIWFEMPWEIRQRILEFTDLVAPYDLVWVPKYGFNPSYEISYPNHCFVCDSVQNKRFGFLQRSGVFSFECSCWKFPLPLFLTNRQMHEDATRIFYSSNHFKVASHSVLLCRQYWYDLETPNAVHQLVPFVDSVPNHALKYIRSIQFLLDPISGYEQWDDTVNRLQQFGNSSLLSLTLDLSDSEYLRTHFDGHITQAIINKEWQSYKRLIQPIINLARDGLKNFFLYSAWPVQKVGLLPLRDAWERKLECMVMGKDYDSRKCGKYAAPGRWYETDSKFTESTSE
ncbi:hypothetical protein P175DRAFT_050882 [Aspergillus ochraceoroseus IBT 24754]|uniref:F-box domain-containing protein n=1 Tax=Aspergillus ochraceoroseus IBT 24754 TaxID=1392256 RepID=A0A2T5M8E6_9EURO|nr:uncharacterized protein P175DRAFT_050882 [Aspergillus ochraceoroseus IBT 24754]PTU24801.1 hypothetical protein P175DRAFT_050882 [Aspergillus ochraceoroseus IBT 24754]